MSDRDHSYGLDWINEQKLFEVTKHSFERLAKLASSQSLKTPPDPFTIMVQAVLFDQSAESMMAFEKLRAINKSISNAVGSWHQAVLGLAEGWKDLGCSGGDVDLMVRESSDAEPIAVEVKNRYNTIKASDEKHMWDKLESFSKMHGSSSYLVQIVPKTPERYDRPWKVSGRPVKETVRCCDGATAYTWAFGKENALQELYMAFPRVLKDVAEGEPFEDEGMFEYFLISMPTN